MKKIAVTYIATKTIIIECDDNGKNADGYTLYPQPVDPGGLTEVIHKVEAENAPELLSEWVANGSANVSVHVSAHVE